MTKISNLSSPDSFFQAQNAPKSVSAKPPLGELTTLPQTPSPFPSPLDPFERLELGASVFRPPLTKNPGYATGL